MATNVTDIVRHAGTASQISIEPKGKCMDDEVRFSTTLLKTERGHVRAPLPFDPRDVWGRKPRHYVKGTIAGTPFIGSVGFADGIAFVVLSSDFRRQAGIGAGDTVEVALRLREPV